MSARRKIARTVARQRRGYAVRIAHDADCSFIVTGRCTCKPDVFVRRATPEVVADDAAAERAWAKERLH